MNNLSAPKMSTLMASAAFVLLGILAALVSIPALSPYALWIVVLGFVILVAGTLIQGL